MNPSKVTADLRPEAAGRIHGPDREQVNNTVLSVEDDDASYFLICSSLRELGSRLAVERVENGEDALEFLRHSGAVSDASRPSLILLDLNLPRISGPEVLAAISGDERLRDIPVVIFSSSCADADRVKCLALGARQFITKPNNYREFVNAIRLACGHAHVK